MRRIPRGRVCSYGQIARWLGLSGGARQVGWAMRALDGKSDLPWHRVVNSRGRVSLGGRPGDLQRALLESEGIEFDARGRLDLTALAWEPGEEE